MQVIITLKEEHIKTIVNNILFGFTQEQYEELVKEAKLVNTKKERKGNKLLIDITLRRNDAKFVTTSQVCVLNRKQYERLVQKAHRLISKRSEESINTRKSLLYHLEPMNYEAACRFPEH